METEGGNSGSPLVVLIRPLQKYCIVAIHRSVKDGNKFSVKITNALIDKLATFDNELVKKKKPAISFLTINY